MVNGKWFIIREPANEETDLTISILKSERDEEAVSLPDYMGYQRRVSNWTDREFSFHLEQSYTNPAYIDNTPLEVSKEEFDRLLYMKELIGG